jgi:arabinogalactan oligomer/maltooligosaccharide transport system substrate-binding protein
MKQNVGRSASVLMAAATPKSGGSRALIVAIVVVVVIIAGIGGYLLVYKKSSTTTTSTAPPPTSSSKVSITVWQDFSTTEFPVFQKALKWFEQNYTNVSVSWVNQTTPAPSTIVSAAIAGRAPNILIGTSDFEGSTLFYHGLLVNISAYVNSSFFSQYASTALSDVTENGTVYAFPLNINGIAMIYNKQLIPTLPQTTNQMIDMAKNITVIQNGKMTTAGVAYGLDTDGGYRFVAWLAGFGGYLFAANGTPTVDTPATVEALEFLNNLTTVYNVQPAGLTSSEWMSLFETGHAGIIFDGPWDIETYLTALGPNNVGVAPMPIVSQTGLRPRPFLGSIAIAVLNHRSSGASAAQIWASIKFGEFMASRTVELQFWNAAGDFPSVTSALDYVMGLNISWAQGFAEQFLNYSQHFINIPQLAYYWTPFGQYVSEFIATNASHISAAQAAADIQNAIVQSMKQNNIAPYFIVANAQVAQKLGASYLSIATAPAERVK